MINIVFGLVAISLGLWGLVKYWWYAVDIFISLFPLVLLGFGTVALLAGIKNTGLKAASLGKNNNQGATKSTTTKKDE